MGSRPTKGKFARRVAAALLGVTLTAAVSYAATIGNRLDYHPARIFSDPDLDAALVVEAKSGAVIYARNASAPRHPASLTKMMTLYLLFEKLKHGGMTLQSRIWVSAHAASQPRSHLGLRKGSAISADLAIRAIVVCSANDVAVAIAEEVGGSEWAFSRLMNDKAAALGMAHTHYANATGLPDDTQVTTAEDLAVLSRRLIYDFPEYFAYFKVTELSWHGDDFTTHNALIGSYAGADGIKTGYIDASGYNLVTTVERDGKRLIAVVMGGLSAERRDREMVSLLDASFRAPFTVVDVPPPPKPPGHAAAPPAEPVRRNFALLTGVGATLPALPLAPGAALVSALVFAVTAAVLSA